MTLYKGTQKVCPIVTVGTTPNLQTKSVNLTNKNGQTFSADNGYDGLSSITVTPNNQARTVTPTTSSQSLTVNSGYSGNGTITVNAVTSSIDSNITAGNIKKDVSILGVTGTYEGSGGGSFVGINREVVNGEYKAPTTSFTFSLPSTATSLGHYALYHAFYGYGSVGLTSVDLSSLTTVQGDNSMSSAFYGCTNLTTVDMSNVTTIKGNLAMNSFCRGCTNLTTVNLSNLKTVEDSNNLGNAFYNCANLENINFNNLQTIGLNTSSNNYGHFNYCFYGCSKITTLSFPKLTTIYCTGNASYGTFASNNKVQKMYFPKLDTITYGSGASSTKQAACKNIFQGCSSLTELHFGSANQSAIQATAGYSTAWGRGAGNVTIYFDL